MTAVNTVGILKKLTITKINIERQGFSLVRPLNGGKHLVINTYGAVGALKEGDHIDRFNETLFMIMIQVTIGAVPPTIDLFDLFDALFVPDPNLQTLQ